MKYYQTLGSLLSPTDFRDYRYKIVSKQQSYPENFKLSLSSNVLNQGNVSSCVACALSSLLEFYNKKEMSIGYIYGNRKNSKYKGKGMYVRDALDNLRRYGDVEKYKYFQETEEVPQAIEEFEKLSENPTILKEGRKNKIYRYYRLKTSKEIKDCLMKFGPVIVVVDWYNDMYVKNGLLVTSGSKSDYKGQHCMILYGWDNRGWKVQNSWGIWWGNRGRCVIPYDTKLKESWGVDVNTCVDVYRPSSNILIRKTYRILNAVARLVHKLIDR